VRHDPDTERAVVARVRAVCRDLPQSYEEAAWVGARWRIRKRTFAHVLTIDAGWPPAYARAAEDDGPIVVLMFRSRGLELHALRNMGPPFFAPNWRQDEVGVVLDDNRDWEEIAELITESYRAQAPRHLATRVGPPPDTDHGS
jgi:hypothetical protein